MNAKHTVALLLAACASQALATDESPLVRPDFQVIDDYTIVVEGVTYHSWNDLAKSGYFDTEQTHCLARPSQIAGPARGSATDCNFNNTSIESQYDPSNGLIRIPVVVHVIQNSSGTGFISESRVQSQIDVLNEDFQAIAGTNGANGTDTQFEFFLATEDPDGNPTNGITYSTNNSWFNDSGSYWNSLAWDTDRYLNIYTNSASGALGYVPDLPQGGIAGSNADRVVVLYSSFGRNAPLTPFHLGRTTTHEVGHYLGLYHTFDNGCGTSSCYTTGDRICDTNRENSPTFGCPGSRTSCGMAAPLDNYMDYSDDICMEKFTPEQANRMRCTLEHYRPNLASDDTGGPCSPADLVAPFGALDFSDVTAFLLAFNGGAPQADLALPTGVFDFSDIVTFLGLFSAGCP
ncbi:MAG: M43 family zinc metalloprotease [Phycisphaerales bacterium JB059]